MKCHVCGTEFDLMDLIDLVEAEEQFERGEVCGQEVECSECHEPYWVHSSEIEDFMQTWTTLSQEPVRG